MGGGMAATTTPFSRAPSAQGGSKAGMSTMGASSAQSRPKPAKR